MFKIGDLVSHYKEGVCEIAKIGALEMAYSDKNKDYYTLKPIYNPAGTLYVPVESGLKQLRTLISFEEANDLIKLMPDIPTLQVKEEKKREGIYKEALLKNECVSWVSLIKTSFLRKKERIDQGKKVINIDERYLGSAEKFLLGELAVILDIPRDKIREFLRKELNQM